MQILVPSMFAWWGKVSEWGRRGIIFFKLLLLFFVVVVFFSEREVPALPPRKVFGRFEPKFLCSRQEGLKTFLEK